MLVGGIFHGATPVRAVASPVAPAQADTVAASEQDDLRPTYFRSISSISPGSFAAAYQAIRAQEAASGSAAAPAGEPAILSGAGIPAALDAYGEAMDTD